ncbi:MAG: DUF922 domain-containing protein [Sphingomicrobium sp.]
MLSLFIALATTAAQAATAPQQSNATSATTGHRLKDVPNVTLSYYDVQGKDGKAIEKNLKAVRTDKTTKQFSAVSSNWNVAATVTKSTTDGKCTIKAVKPQFSATVTLPRLANEAAVKPEVLTQWRSYVAGLETSIADNFFFVYEQLPALQNSVTGLECSAGAAAWDSGIGRIKTAAIQRGEATAAAAKAAAVPAKQ